MRARPRARWRAAPAVAVPLSERHGAWRVMRDDLTIDIAAARGSLTDDLALRDFTVNDLAAGFGDHLQKHALGLCLHLLGDLVGIQLIQRIAALDQGTLRHQKADQHRAGVVVAQSRNRDWSRHQSVSPIRFPHGPAPPSPLQLDAQTAHRLGRWC